MTYAKVDDMYDTFFFFILNNESILMSIYNGEMRMTLFHTG